MKLIIMLSALLACTLGLPGYSANKDGSKFLVDYKTNLEATEVASQDADTISSTENSTTGDSAVDENSANSTDTTVKEKEPDTLIIGIIADVVIIVIIVVYACYQFNKMKAARSRPNSYSRAP